MQVTEQARLALARHADLVRTIVRRRELLVPMLSIWVASFGGGEHAPVTTYFLLELGATMTQLGNFGVIKTVGSLALSPFYGWLLDRRSVRLPVLLSAGCCSFGCLLRGLAPVGDTFSLYASHVILGLGAVNFWNVVGAYLALSLPRDRRDVAVSGFQVQVSVLNLLGTASFPSCDSFLVAIGFHNTLIRYRIHMSVCSLFCVFGLFYMLLSFTPAPRADARPEVREQQKLDQSVDKFQLGLLLFSLVIQAFGESVVLMLWPLHIRKLGWDAHEYAFLDIASKLLVIGGNLVYPALSRHLGARTTASLLPVVACFTSAAAFLQPDPSRLGRTIHVFNALLFLSACGVMKVCYQHLTTLSVPASMQGRVFSILAMLASCGGIAGNLFSTRFEDHATSIAGKGGTPFLLASFLFLVAGCSAGALMVVPPQCLYNELEERGPTATELEEKKSHDRMEAAQIPPSAEE